MARNRWYEPQTGRFLSEDLIGLAREINPYAFAGSDPVNNYDPAGSRVRPRPAAMLHRAPGPCRYLLNQSHPDAGPVTLDVFPAALFPLAAWTCSP